MISLNRLPNQERGEKVVLFLRRHWLELVSLVLYVGILSLAPIILYFALGLFGIDLINHPFLAPATAVLISVYIFVVLLIAMTMFTDYYLDTWIVTNERIINIEQHGLFRRIISTLHLNQVQDVSASTHGFFATFLSFGDVNVQTAGTRQLFHFKAIDNPEDVKATIIKLANEDKKRHGDPLNSGPVMDSSPLKP